MTSPSPWQVQASFSDTDGRVRPTLVLTPFICVALAGWTLVLITGAITAQLRVGLIDSLKNPAAHVDLESVQASDRLTLVMTFLTFCAYLAVAIPMTVWLFRARANALAIRDHGQRWGRPWLIFGWFVPVMNLWVPKQIVDDIWSASEPAQDGRPGIRKPLLVTAWWIALLLYGWADYFVERIQLRGGLTSLHDAARNTVFISPLGILAAVLAAVVVWKIGRFQEEEAVRIAAAPA